MPAESPKSLDVRRVIKKQKPSSTPITPTPKRPFFALFKKRSPEISPPTNTIQKSLALKNETNFWNEQPLLTKKPPTEKPPQANPSSSPSSSWGMYSVLTIGALAFSVITVTIAYYVTNNGQKAAPQAKSSKTTLYQPVSKPGEKNPFTGEEIEPSPTVTVTPTSTPTPSESIPATTIDKQSIRLRVLNGSGVTGDAANMEKQLEQAGFTVSAIGNAKLSYSTSYIYYRVGKNKEADLVAENISNKKITKVESNAIVGANTDVLVVVGKE